MLTCRYCGTKNPPGSTYCNHCGGAFNAAAAQSHANAKAAPAGQKASAGPAPQPAASSASAVRAAHAPSATATPPGKPHNATGSLPPQTRLHGRYLVLTTVGQGGMAAVYRALDTKTRREVAIKEMSQDGLSPDEEKEALEAFQSEAAMLQRLQHPNLPRVWERFSDGARHYLVMDYVDGQTLEQRQQAAGGGPLPEAEVMGWARQLCSVLAYLHTQRPPIIFRDLKPANVMVTKQGQVKLIDFGIARVFHPGRARDTQVLGTPGFAPPEQYGKTQTDARADVYALGVTLYQLLTGYDPASTPFTLPPANSRNPKLAPHIQAALDRATKLDRDQRYPTITAFEQDLLRPDGFIFRGGQRARTVPELVALCRALPQEAEEHLYNGRFEVWLNSIGQRQAAALAGGITRAGGDRGAGLARFMAQATRPQGQPGQPGQPGAQGQAWQTAQRQAQPRPKQTAGAGAQPAAPVNAWSVLAGPGAAQASKIATRLAGQVAKQMGSYTARRLMAQAAAAAATMVGTQILVEVRPRSANFGALIAGQRGQMALSISGQNGLPVSGRIAALEGWLQVSQTTFVGALTTIQLSVDTSRLSPGLHQTNVQITSGTQQVYVPVSVEVLATRAAPPNRPAPGPKPGAKRTGASARWSWLRLSDGARAGLSLGLGGGLAGAGGVELTLQEPALHNLAPQVFVPGGPAFLAVFGAMLVLAAALGATVGRFEAWFLPRLFTAVLLAGLGVGGAVLLLHGGAPGQGSPFASLPGDWLPIILKALMYVGATLGAALGATLRISGQIWRGLAVLRRHARPLLALGFIGLGGALGWMLLQGIPTVGPALAPCGMIVGGVAAAVLVTRTMRVRQRTIPRAPHP